MYKRQALLAKAKDLGWSGPDSLGTSVSDSLRGSLTVPTWIKPWESVPLRLVGLQRPGGPISSFDSRQANELGEPWSGRSTVD